jgi:toxin ParE1/3/4
VKSLDVSAPARADLRDIQAFSIHRWGRRRADDYIGLIIARFAWLMENSARGAPQDHIQPGLRRVNVRRHAIFYRDLPATVEISRVLHQRMDHAQIFSAAHGDGQS